MCASLEEMIMIKKLTLGNYPTPIFDISHVVATQSPSKKLWIKREDYSGIELSGNKTRKLQYALAEAKAMGADVVITAGAIQSNHCRATVAACRSIGIKPHIMLFGEAGKAEGGNLLIDTLLGSEITYVNPQEYANYLSIMEGIAFDYKQMGLKAYLIPIGASNGIGNFGYVDTYSEILQWCEQACEQLDAIVCGVGSGGTYAGLWLGQYLLKGEAAFKDTKIVGISVSADAQTFKAKVLAILEETLAYRDLLLALNPDFSAEQMFKVANETITIVDGYQGEGYAIPYEACDRRIKWFAAQTGIVLDSVYTGKAFHGMMCTLESELPKAIHQLGNSVLFIHTGGLFGMFGQKSRGGA